MTYLGFLLQFVFLPGIILLVWLVIDARRGKTLPSMLKNWPVWLALVAHSLVALIYTTPWDNYLVATRVWWYDENLVTGLVLGWVPIEEYIFFVVQPVFTGLLLLTLMRYLPPPAEFAPANRLARPVSLAVVGAIWLASVMLLASGYQPGTYLGLELVWALLPVMLQLAFGADILWKYRRYVIPAILISTLYLAYADSLAIGSGTWTIDPEQSLQIYIGGVLPVEELIFFFLTNVLLVFGVTLVLAQESRARVPARLLALAR